MSILTNEDLYYWKNGQHDRLYELLGAHPCGSQSPKSMCRTWAPHAQTVSVVGDFNNWQSGADPLELGDGGLWTGWVDGLANGGLYKFAIQSPTGEINFKADPYGRMHESAPNTASIVQSDAYAWGDDTWLQKRIERDHQKSPISIYEVHLESWMRCGPGGESYKSYGEVALPLALYVKELGFTHVEFLPLLEHPFGGSWGYQVTGYFSPTSRFGTPQELKALVDTLHQHNIGVILDWVPAHFPFDAHGLAQFDGEALYEYSDPKRGYHPDWNTAIFDYGRPEVRSFLISSAHMWIDQFHFDGIRVDAVASMLYLDYSREEGQWIPNQFGGNHNLEAIELLKTLNQTLHSRFPGVLTIAEESTAFDGVSKPVEQGGLGFDFKWDMGWMHDTLSYFEKEPIHRKHHQNNLTFRMVYAYSESFMLPLSHDEVVHGKKSLLNKMQGDPWQQYANLRLLLANMFAQPGKKLLFMGAELGMRQEWQHEQPLPWPSSNEPLRMGLRRLIQDLNKLYQSHPALYQCDAEPDGFRWLDFNDCEQSVTSFIRLANDASNPLVVIFNHTPEVRHDYRIGIPEGGNWQEALNTDAAHFGGSALTNPGYLVPEPIHSHGHPQSLSLTLPPLGAIFMTLNDGVLS
jgi:1,4-alpha-glucan branching enzyme